MGTRLIAKDSDYEDDAVEYLAPVRRGLEAIHLLNKSAAKAAKNYAPDKSNGVFVGSPLAANEQFIRFKGQSVFVQSEVREARAMTLFAVVRTLDALADDATRPQYFGTYRSPPADGSGGTTYGVAMYNNTATTLSAMAGRGNSLADHVSGSVNTSNPSQATWSLMSLRVGVGVQEGTILKNETTGVEATLATNLNLPRYPSLGKFRIGSGYTLQEGQCDMAYWQAHSVELTPAEIAIVLADIRAHMARRSITV
ncbi:hypothetical protein [Brevundimonas olei]|uniref:hypothetical protein n=1 Tax=Brevundimonas olei TaxID=657642 RepID=UPI0031D0E0A0